MTARLLRPGELGSVLPAGGLTLVSSCSAESDLLGAEVAAAGEALGGSSHIVAPGAGHGIANLRFKDHHERARVLIAVAAPDHREALEQAWRPVAAQL